MTPEIISSPVMVLPPFGDDRAGSFLPPVDPTVTLYAGGKMAEGKEGPEM